MISEPAMTDSTRRQFFTRGRLAVAVAVMLTSAGCLGGGLAQSGRGTIADIHLFGVPTALNFDGIKKVDGIGVRIYASAPKIARGVAIDRGELEVLMYEGSVSDNDIRTATPSKVWRFEAVSLRPFTAETSLGIGYQLALRWGKDLPLSQVVTVVARYRSPTGVDLYSTTTSISVASK